MTSSHRTPGRRRSTRRRARSILAFSLAAGLGAASGCTSILGGFDYNGSSTGAGGSTSSSSSSSGGVTCAAGGTACQSEAQCPMPGVCVLATCVAGCCGVEDAPLHTPAPSADKVGDCHRAECDGKGMAVHLVDDTDAPDDGESCTKDACDLGSPTHTPIVGSCSKGIGHVCGDPAGASAGTCVECNVNGDCTGGSVCISSACKPPGCADKMTDGDESDVDCGGSCLPCPDSLACKVAKDCASLSCGGNVCLAATCQDSIANGLESDIDCGGVTCVACGAGKHCNVPSDCLGNLCTNHVCAPTCYDAEQNQGETDVDCGGPCIKCEFQKHCAVAADCVSGWCNPVSLKCDAEILAAGEASPGPIAVDGTNVYWVTGGAGNVRMLTLGTASPVTIDTGASYGAIAVDGSLSNTSAYVYWTNALASGTVKRRRVDKTTPTETLASNQSTPNAGLAVDSTAVYWANDGDGSIRKVVLSTMAVQNVTTTAQQASPGGMYLTLGNGKVYWSSVNAIALFSVPVGGGMAQMLLQTGPTGVAVDSLNIYWNAPAILQLDMMPNVGGAVQQLYGGVSSGGALVFDGTTLYTYENVPGTARILSFAPQTFKQKWLAVGMDRPGGIAFDKFYVYFTNGDGTIRRVLK